MSKAVEILTDGTLIVHTRNVDYINKIIVTFEDKDSKLFLPINIDRRKKHGKNL